MILFQGFQVDTIFVFVTIAASNNVCPVFVMEIG